MSIKLCPRCYAVRNMLLTTSTRTTTGPDGKVKEIRTNLFYCDTCNSFIGSEDIEFLEDFRRSSVPVTKSMCQMTRPDTLYALIGNLISLWWKTRYSLASPLNLTILSDRELLNFPLQRDARFIWIPGSGIQMKRTCGPVSSVRDMCLCESAAKGIQDRIWY